MQIEPASPSRLTAGGHSSEATVPITVLVNILLQERRLNKLLPLVFLLVALGGSVLRPRQYRADASFIPESGDRNLNSNASVIAQLGLELNAIQGSRNRRTPFSVAQCKSAHHTADAHPTIGSLREECCGDTRGLFEAALDSGTAGTL